MVKYHGLPVGGEKTEAIRFLRGRHGFISFAHPDDISLVDIMESFALDNGAFSLWRGGTEPDWEKYVDDFVGRWSRHPGYDFAICPDVIGGTEDDNMDLVARYLSKIPNGVPVWHLHESLDYLKYLGTYPRIALGSSGVYSTPGTKTWWDRIEEAMEVICLNGVPRCKIHGLRMLNPDLFSIPFSSADSTNAVRNASSTSRFGTYLSPSRGQRCEIIATIIEAFNSSPVWIGRKQSILELC